MVDIIDTAGSADANSFVSVAYADAYHDAHLDGEVWLAALERKAIALIMATRTLDALRWRGSPRFTGQALQLPRSGLVNRSGYYLDGDIVPRAVKDATSELARLLLVEAASDAETSAEVVKKLKAGPVELEFAVPAGGVENTTDVPSSVMAFISHLVIGSTTMLNVPLMRL